MSLNSSRSLVQDGPHYEKTNGQKPFFTVVITQFYEIAQPFFLVDWIALGVMAFNFLLINVVFFAVGWVGLHREGSSGQNIDYDSGLVCYKHVSYLCVCYYWFSVVPFLL